MALITAKPLPQYYEYFNHFFHSTGFRHLDFSHSISDQFWLCCYDIQQMALFQLTACTAVVLRDRLLSARASSVGFLKSIFVWRETHETLVLLMKLPWWSYLPTASSFLPDIEHFSHWTSSIHEKKSFLNQSRSSTTRRCSKALSIHGSWQSISFCSLIAVAV